MFPSGIKGKNMLVFHFSKVELNIHKLVKPFSYSVVIVLNFKKQNMKKVLVSVLIAMLAVGSSYAQPGGYDPAARLQKEIDGLTKALTLTKDQVEKVTPIVAAGQKKQSELYAKMREGGGDVDRDKMREELTKLQAETDKELKAVLTAEQAPKLDAYRKQQAEERAKRMQQMN